jgi:hypothetical protein
LVVAVYDVEKVLPNARRGRKVETGIPKRDVDSGLKSLVDDTDSIGRKK